MHRCPRNRPARTFRSIILTIAFLSLAFPPGLSAHREDIHQYLALQAYNLLVRRYPALASTELAPHIGARAGNCEGFQFTAGTVTSGAYREDCEDPVYHYGDVPGALDDAYFGASHFWDADAGDASRIEICDVSCGRYSNAFQKSLRYVLPGIYGRWTAKLTWPSGIASFNLQGGGTGAVSHNGLIGFEYDSLARLYRDGTCTITGYMDITGKWQTAATVPDRLPMKIVAPKAVRDRICWEVIGRIAHLIGDMGVPAHAHNDIHPPFWWSGEPADIFEEEMGRLYTAWTAEDALAQGGLLDLDRAVPGGSAERTMRFLFYATNQVADRFPSNDSDGDAVYDLQWEGDDYSDLALIGRIEADPAARSVFHREAADYAFVFSMRAIAGLLEWFAREAGILAEIAVAADFPGAVILTDGKPRPTPFMMTLVKGTRFTLEAADQTAADPLSGSPVTMKFASWERTVPPEGPAPGTIRLLTEQATGGAAYEARFDRVVTICLTPARHLDGGSGGSYSMNGVDIGGEWSGPVNTGTIPSFTLGFTPPPGAVFLGWSDGGDANPRELRPGGNVNLRAVCKRRLLSTVPGPGRPANQRRIALTGCATGDRATAVMTYASGGDVFYSESVDGVRWSKEELVSDGRGNARDPSIEYVGAAAAGDRGTSIVWEDTLPGGAGRRILSRFREDGTRRWGGIAVVQADTAMPPHRGTPVISADLVAWRVPDGIVARRLSGGGTFSIPGTGRGSSSPLVDCYSPVDGKFAVGWIDDGDTLRFARGAFPGPAWSASRPVAVTGPGDTIAGADLALAATGSGCVAWVSGSGGEWKVSYRIFDQSDVFAASVSATACPITGPVAPLLRVAHHRLDAEATRDLGLHLWIPPRAAVLSLRLRSSLKIGPSIAAAEGPYPDIPREAVSATGIAPVVYTSACDNLVWSIVPSAISPGPALPAAPSPASPASGARDAGETVRLAWDCSPDATTYAVQLSRSGSFAAPLVADFPSIAGTSVSVSNLQPGTLYYWRARAVNSLGAGAFSPVWSFTTCAPPAAPAIAGSIVATASGPRPKLSWSAPAGTASFRLYRYLCAGAIDCAAASRPALIYEGTSTSFIDGSITVASKLASGRAFYYVTATGAGFTGPPSNTVSFSTQANVICSEDPPLPRSSGLGENYPNPFNPSTTVPYHLSSPAHVTIRAINLLGQKVAILFDGTKGAGFHEVRWDASGLPAGIYFITMEFGGGADGAAGIDRRKVLLLK